MSATIFANNGGDILTLKSHGGWKSSTVAEDYLEHCLGQKARIAKMVQGTSIAPALPSTSTAIFDTLPSTSITNTEVNIPVQNINK